MNVTTLLVVVAVAVALTEAAVLATSIYLLSACSPSPGRRCGPPAHGRPPASDRSDSQTEPAVKQRQAAVRYAKALFALEF